VCNAAGSEGTCTVVASGAPGAGPVCSPYLCDGIHAGCPTLCAGDGDCIAADYCDATSHCAARKAPLAIASLAVKMASGW